MSITKKAVPVTLSGATTLIKMGGNLYSGIYKVYQVLINEILHDNTNSPTIFKNILNADFLKN